MAEKDDKPGGFSVSRRDFLKTAGVVSAVTAATSPAEAEAQAAVNGVGPGNVPVRLTVNGKRVDLMIEPRVTLLDALRMRADLTGNKRGCDRGACGACTMVRCSVCVCVHRMDVSASPGHAAAHAQPEELRGRHGLDGD